MCLLTLHFTISAQQGAWQPPHRTCSQLQFSGSFNHGDESSSLPVGCCTSQLYRFVYVRQAGKLGGTTVQKSFLLPTLCAAHINSTSKKSIHLFGGAEVPYGCEEYLRRFGLLDCTCKESSQLPKDISFLVVRHPFARFISIYKYVLEEWSRRHNNHEYIGISTFVNHL